MGWCFEADTYQPGPTTTPDVPQMRGHFPRGALVSIVDETNKNSTDRHDEERSKEATKRSLGESKDESYQDAR